ncbi:sigma-54 interaction domain-containing protein [Novipirellula artificiosorum]|uniref:Transcriptional regulatory protein ZraR n=1 Tax=Novipirellula artificiosorum TaxID=2528016 RepID=A0A5C6DTK2_9BACT|nr:sigma 54-interacting transcriptional regulator [Novipirellula artificiosorum]TWU39207.1 Transcriptional regulatory protein ZraR [Novipirellula artificiosorum]
MSRQFDPNETSDPNETILNSIADGVFTVDSDWRITSFNRAAEEITGVSRDEAIGQKCFDVFQANICQSNCALRDSMKSGRQWVDRRIDILNRDGEKVPISISTSVLRDADGKPFGGVETFRDLSAIESLRREIDGRYSQYDIITKNHAMLGILDILPDIAASETSVLVQGATGTGKELIAKAIHSLSRRADERFVAVNCGALPDALLESELFGYRKGAFTGADKDKPGRFALAEKGTLFLDEIGDISTALQVRLLRVLQQREYEPLGATETTSTDVRVIAATNKTLAEQIATGKFREDLYYRLNVVRIELPTLAERSEDIPLLIHHFMNRFNLEQQKQVQGVSDEAMARLADYPYPGNVRELQNIIEHAVVLCRSDRIEVDNLPMDLLTNAVTAPGKAAPLSAAESDVIVRMLSQHQGHRGRTAEALGIDKTTLWRKMKKYGIRYPG